MGQTRIPDAVKRVFLEAFTARDIAEPLASFDAGAPSAAVRDLIRTRGLAAVGIRRDGQVAGYVQLDRLGDGACGEYLQAFDEKAVLEDDAPLLNVLTRLQEIPIAFVSVLGSVGGIVARADLQKPPVRMWLFGIVTLIEMRCTSLIEEHCPGGTWKQYLSGARLQKAQALLDERRRRNQALGLLDCLQFSDKGQIVARHEDMRNRTVFASRRQAEEAIKRLEQLRNNLAHAQDIIVSDWQTIVQLCGFVPGH
jgi:hypothetical protein